MKIKRKFLIFITIVLTSVMSVSVTTSPVGAVAAEDYETEPPVVTEEPVYTTDNPYAATEAPPATDAPHYTSYEPVVTTTLSGLIERTDPPREETTEFTEPVTGDDTTEPPVTADVTAAPPEHGTLSPYDTIYQPATTTAEPPPGAGAMVTLDDGDRSPPLVLYIIIAVLIAGIGVATPLIVRGIKLERIYRY